jgi:hypothetical protein
MDLLKVTVPECTVEDVIEPVYTIQADERVVHLRRRMLDDNITKFIVKDNSKVIGIVTETDVATVIEILDLLDTHSHWGENCLIITDDYYHLPAVKQAMDEWTAKHGLQLKEGCWVRWSSTNKQD